VEVQRWVRSQWLGRAEFYVRVRVGDQGVRSQWLGYRVRVTGVMLQGLCYCGWGTADGVQRSGNKD
jgi:hypothetical protein